jgi:hypothetical protein
MGCRGLHCDGCNPSGGGPAAAVVVLLVIGAVALRSVWPQLVRVLEIAGWTAAALSGTVLAAAGGVGTVRVVRAVRARRARRQYITPGQGRPAGRAIPGGRRVPSQPVEPPPWRPVAGWAVIERKTGEGER